MKKQHLVSEDLLNPAVLRQQIFYLKTELDKYRSKVQNYQENYHYSQLENLKIENGELLEELNRSKNQIEEMNKEKQSAQLLQNHIDSLEIKLAKYQSKQLNDEDEIQNLQHINAKLKEETHQLQEERLTLESFQVEMFDKIEDLKQEITSYKSGEMTAFASQNTKQLDENNKLYQQIQDLLSQMNEYGEKISASVSFTNQLEEHIDNLTEEIKRLKKQIANHFHS